MKTKKNKKQNIDYKIFSVCTTKQGSCVRLFGCKIYEEISNELFRIQKFCGNLIYTKKLRSTTKDRKIFKIFNLPISERITVNDKIQYNILNYPVKTMDLANIFYNQYLKKIKYDYDDVYILHANSGETYIFFAYCVNAVLRKNNSKKPLFIATQDYHVDILKMYLPNANCVFFKHFATRAKSDKWYVKGHTCYMVFSANHFLNLGKNIYRKGISQVHYLDNISETLEISKKDFTKPIVKIPQEVKQSLKYKIGSINLNLSKFVIIAPEAQTCEELPISLWQNLVKELQQRGFDIFLNIVNKDNYIDGCKSIFLTYQEVYALTQKAMAVISLRSGFTEFVLPAEIPNITVYTKFREQKRITFSVDKTISAFTMHKFPFINHDLVCELNKDEYEDEDKLLQAIMTNFDRRVTREAQLV